MSEENLLRNPPTPPPNPPPFRAPLSQSSALLSPQDNQKVFRVLGRGRQSIATAVVNDVTLTFICQKTTPVLNAQSESFLEPEAVRPPVEIKVTPTTPDPTKPKEFFPPVPKPRGRARSSALDPPSSPASSFDSTDPKTEKVTKVEEEKTTKIDSLKRAEAEVASMKQKRETYDKWASEGQLDANEVKLHHQLQLRIIDKEAEIEALKLDLERINDELEKHKLLVRLEEASPKQDAEVLENSIGVACLVRDTLQKSYFIEVISLDVMRIMYGQEINNRFQHKLDKELFLTLDGNGPSVCIQFADATEASKFHSALKGKLESKQRLFIRNESKNRRSDFTPLESDRTIPTRKSSPNLFEQKSEEYIAPAPTATPREFRQRQMGKLTKKDIGEPTDFRHVQHIGWDQNAGFKLSLQDRDMQTFFKKAGISSSDHEELNGEPKMVTRSKSLINLYSDSTGEHK